MNEYPIPDLSSELSKYVGPRRADVNEWSYDMLNYDAEAAKEARDRAVICRTLLLRGSDGAGGVVLDDMYAVEVARRVFKESIEELRRRVNEFMELEKLLRRHDLTQRVLDLIESTIASKGAS